MPPPPPPPPPPGAGHAGPPPPMPPQLQAMMRQMQKRQPKFQQQIQPPASYQPHQGGRGGFRGGRGGGGRAGAGRHSGRGRGGRGRGGFQQQNHRQNRGYNQTQFKRKRGPSDDVRDGSRLFLPSFLEDPWKELEAVSGRGNGRNQNVAGETKYGGRQQQREEMRPRQMQQYATEDGPGRVFFQPSFLEDPWVQLVR